MEFVLIGGNQNISGCSEHMHGCFEITVQKSGMCKAYVGCEEFDIVPGDIVIIPPQTKHCVKSDSLFSDMYLQISSLPANIPANITDTKKLHDYSGNIEKLLSVIYDIKIKNNNNSKNIINSLAKNACELVFLLENEKYRHPFTVELKNIIEKNISNAEFSIADAITDKGYNYDYIRHCFKSDIKISPLEYLISIRINHAKDMLSDFSSFPIHEIARACGFNDSYYFSKVFKKKTGLSPKKYRDSF